MSSLLFGASLLSTAFAAVTYGGVNIAGFDFGCGTDGTCTISSVDPPLASSGGSDGLGQMAHFATDDNMNIFRLPVAWQYLTNDVVGATLDTTNLATYDTLVQGCLATGAACIIDIHNYARWNGVLIGASGGPTNDEFADLWSQLATKYASEDKVMFGIMNEPHDLTSVSDWGVTVQAAVTAIRTAGATSQVCLLPGNGYTSAATFVSGGSYAALENVTNLDGTTDNLVFDVHKYLDSDGSGTNAACASDEISDAFEPLATQLRTDGRLAMLSETGGGASDSSCMTDVCAAIDYLNTNDDVYMGYVGWAAGSFATDYVLSLTPSGSNSTGWTDQELMSCFARNATTGSTTTSSSAVASSTVASSSSVATSSVEASTTSSSVVASTTAVESTTAASSSVVATSSAVVATTSSVATSAEASSTSSSAVVYSTTAASSTSEVASVSTSATSVAAYSTSSYSAPTTFATSVKSYHHSHSSAPAPEPSGEPDECEF